jgi:hypothetical protein
MRDHSNVIEKLPISAVNRAIARANYDASEALIDRIDSALAWLREFGPVAIYTVTSVAVAVALGVATYSFVPT